MIPTQSQRLLLITHNINSLNNVKASERGQKGTIFLTVYRSFYNNITYRGNKRWQWVTNYIGPLIFSVKRRSLVVPMDSILCEKDQLSITLHLLRIYYVCIDIG